MRAMPMQTCCNMKPPKKSKLPPGKQRWRRCDRPSDLMVSLHQHSEHIRIGSGWFEIPLCDACFKEGMANRD